MVKLHYNSYFSKPFIVSVNDEQYAFRSKEKALEFLTPLSSNHSIEINLNQDEFKNYVENISFDEKLKNLLTEKENTQFKDAEPTDIEKLNKDPESKQKPDEKFELPKEAQYFNDFIKFVNPVHGDVKKCALFKYVKYFRQRGKDIIICNGEKNSEVDPFYAVDRGQLTAYLQTIMDDKEKFDDFKSKIKTIYTIEQTELMPVDYIDFTINNKITIHNNPATELTIDGQSKLIPNIMEPKNQDEMKVDLEKVEK